MKDPQGPYITRELGGIVARVYLDDLDQNTADDAELYDGFVADAARAVLLTMGIDPDSDGREVVVEEGGKNCVVSLHVWNIDDGVEWEIIG